MSNTSSTNGTSTNGTSTNGLPSIGTPVDEVLAEIDRLSADDIDWRSGRAFSLVYNADDPELERLQREVVERYFHENALNPFAYPSLRSMERSVVGFAASLFHGDPRAGTMSSGGTESIFLAVQVARDEARSRGVRHPNIVLPATAHPAFAKAAHYLGVEEVRVPVGPDLRADVDAMRDAVGPDTSLVVGSAPCYPFGVIDPIEEIAAVAQENNSLCHVDACLGGWLLPFWEELLDESEPPLAPWDFRVAGVTSISADIHKYGWCFKGASVIMHRSMELKQRQHFQFEDWPGGTYGSATTAGTRPASPIAGAWATITHLGREGYLAKASVVKQAAAKFIDGITALEGVSISGQPKMSLFEFSADAGPDATARIAAALIDAGWRVDQQAGGIHVMLSPVHLRVADEFLAALAEAVAHGGGGTAESVPYSGIA